MRAKDDYPQLICTPIGVLDSSEAKTAFDGVEDKGQASLVHQGEDLPKSGPDELHSHVTPAEDIRRDQSGSQSKGVRKRSEPVSPEQLGETPKVSSDPRKVDVTPEPKADLTVQQKLL